MVSIRMDGGHDEYPVDFNFKIWILFTCLLKNRIFFLDDDQNQIIDVYNHIYIPHTSPPMTLCFKPFKAPNFYFAVSETFILPASLREKMPEKARFFVHSFCEVFLCPLI